MARLMRLPNGKYLMDWHLEVLAALLKMSTLCPDDARTKRDVLNRYPHLFPRHWWRLERAGLCRRVKSAESGRKYEF